MTVILLILSKLSKRCAPNKILILRTYIATQLTTLDQDGRFCHSFSFRYLGKFLDNDRMKKEDFMYNIKRFSDLDSAFYLEFSGISFQ
jgi:hypothetical protein